MGFNFLDPAGLFEGGGGSILDPMGLFGKKKGGGLKEILAQAMAQAPEEPAETVMSPTVMPSPDSDAQRAARRKSLTAQARRKGRSSTILSNLDPLGAGD